MARAAVSCSTLEVGRFIKPWRGTYDRPGPLPPSVGG